MKPGCMPKTLFASQIGIHKHLTQQRPYSVVLEECEKQYKEKSIVTEQSSSEEIASGSSVCKRSRASSHLTHSCCYTCRPTLSGASLYGRRRLLLGEWVQWIIRHTKWSCIANP